MVIDCVEEKEKKTKEQRKKRRIWIFIVDGEKKAKRNN